MRLLELRLDAYGPFTDQSIDFTQEPSRLHIVYGPNEAGKSSALRALGDLFYGIPERTNDNFLHANTQLQIGGHIRSSNGQALDFLRRKRRKNALLNREEDPLDETVLSQFLNGIGRRLFENLFGIDHEALEHGGKELLEQKGEMGKGLFSAGLGTVKLQQFLSELDQQSKALFLPRGSNPAINITLSRYKDLQRQSKEAALSARDWEDQHQALSAAKGQLVQLDQERSRVTDDIHRLQRLKALLPLLTRRRELLARRENLDPHSTLTDDFGKRHGTLLKRRESTTETCNRTRARLEKLGVACEQVQVSEAILNQAEMIESLYQQLHSYREWVKTRPATLALRQQLHADAATLLSKIRPDLSLENVEPLRQLLAKRTRILTLGNQHQALLQRRARVNKTWVDTQHRLQTLHKALKQSPPRQDLGPLRLALDAAKRAGDLDDNHKDIQQQQSTLKEQCETKFSRLGLWRGELDRLDRLPIPSTPTMDRFNDELQTAQHKRARNDDTIAELQDALADLQQPLEEIQRAGSIPTEEALVVARQRRDQGWQLLRRQWLEREDVTVAARQYAAHQSLPEAYEQDVKGADEFADRLWREGHRRQQYASLVAQKEDLTRRLKTAEEQRQQGLSQQADLLERWQQQWHACGIDPLMPKEMLAWATRYEALCERLGQLRELDQKQARIRRSITEYVEALNATRSALGIAVQREEKNLATVLRQSETDLAKLEHSDKAQHELTNELTQQNETHALVEREQAQTDADWKQWQAQWLESIRGLGLDANATPAEASEVLDLLQQIFSKLDEATQSSSRLAHIEQRLEDYREQTHALVVNVAPELAKSPTEPAVIECHARLLKERENHARLAALETQIKETETEQVEAEATLSSVETHLSTLCSESGCERPEQLQAIIAASDEYRSLSKELSPLEQQLIEIGGGTPMDELEQQAKAVDKAHLPTQIEQLQHTLETQITPAIKHHAEHLGEANIKLLDMNGNARAAELAEQAEALLAELRSQVERYVQLKLASRLLDEEISRYREQHQGPLLQRASEYFRKLTLNSFAALRADFDSNDNPILVGLRPNKHLVQVEGMSSGTRDQLYLALRLATLEQYYRTSEPLPFIIDDILINFDDARSSAALEIFQELAGTTQVILFTHHQRIVSQASELKDKNKIVIHELATPK